jgi:hypothetical protein
MKTTKQAKTWTKEGKYDGLWWALSWLTIVMIASLAFTSRVHAADFSTALNKALAEVPVGADVAGMGGTNTASPDFSSSNPAIIGVEGTEKFKASATATYGYLSFKSGMRINLYSLSVAAQLPVGVIQVTGIDAKSNTVSLGEFGDDKLKFNSMPSIGLQYGLPVAKNLLLKEDSLYLGVSYNYSQSKMTGRSVIGTPATTFVVDLKNESIGQMAGVGALYRIGKLVNVGASYGHTWDKAKDFYNGELDSETRSESDTLRLGLSAQITPMTMIAFDYQHLYLPAGERDDQYFAGAEQYLIKDLLAVYGGYANGGITGGLGLYLEHGGLNLAYVNRGLRQLDEFLGKSEIWMVSVYGTF